jgi:sugar transferase (PEP-CTERM/EpsH1 system associated)
VTVASLVRSAEEAEEGRGIASYCSRHEMARVRDPVQAWRMVACLPTPTPSSMGYFHSPALARRLRRLTRRERFDLVFVHCSSAAQYVAHLRGVPKILDFGDMDSQKWLEYARHKPFPLSLGYRLEGIKLEREEKRLARVFDMCTATTQAEWETLQRHGAATASDWFPNGVDTDYFAPAHEAYEPDAISFVGRMDYYPNQKCMLDFCARVLPLIRARRPATTLRIVGADPSPEIWKLAQLPGVTVTGSVPDVRPYVRRTAVMVAPLNIARGTQNKILEAMAMGVPVMTTPAAAGGVDAVPGEHLVVARTPEEQASAVVRILECPEDRRRIGAAGRRRMLSHHAWPSSMRRMDAIIDRTLASYGTAATPQAQPANA